LDILIFTDNPVVRETGLVCEELTRRGFRVEVKTPWDLSIPDLPNMEAGLVYVPSNMFHRGSTFELVNRFLILEELERKAAIINPLMSLLRYSKEHLTLKAETGGYPHPRTLVTENIEEAYNFASGLLDQGGDVVLKPICRARGVGVTRLSEIRRREDLMQFLTWYVRNQGEGVFYLQEFVKNMGYDIRVFIVDGEVVTRMKRSNPEDFRYNASIGGITEPFEDPIYDELAIKVAETMNLKITGVDVLPSEEGTPYILEANCYPGYTHLIAATGVQIHEKIVDFFQRLLHR
jgi:RimK family alpha-L-glutamate ligase